MSIARIIILPSLAILTLSACAPYRPGHHKARVCNELNSQMIFAGSTANSRNADIQRAEAPMVARTYKRDDCEE